MLALEFPYSVLELEIASTRLKLPHHPSDTDILIIQPLITMPIVSLQDIGKLFADGVNLTSLLTNMKDSSA